MMTVFSNRRVSALAVLCLTAAVNCHLAAQRSLANGATALGNVETGLSTYMQPITNICYVVAAIIGVVGGVQVYSKWTSGDPAAGKTAAGWAAACVFLIMVPTIISTLFGVTIS